MLSSLDTGPYSKQSYRSTYADPNGIEEEILNELGYDENISYSYFADS